MSGKVVKGECKRAILELLIFNLTKDKVTLSSVIKHCQWKYSLERTATLFLFHAI